MQTKITIIVPVYKVEKYLKQCVDSIIAQTYKNLEIILVDDGSPDKCPKICDEYTKTDKRIKVVHKKNGGLSSARNAGLDIATGDFIGFVDSDDYIHPKMFEILLKNALDTNADVSECFLIETYDSNPKKTKDAKISNEFQVLNLEKKDEFEKLVLQGIVSPSVCRRLFKSNLFKTLRFPDGKIYEDALIFPKWAISCKKSVQTSSQLYFYRVRRGSIMQSTFNTKMLDIFEVVESWLRFLTNDYLKSKMMSLCLLLVYNAYHSSNQKKYLEYHKTIKLWLKDHFETINKLKKDFTFKEKFKFFIYKHRFLFWLNKLRLKFKTRI